MVSEASVHILSPQPKGFSVSKKQILLSAENRKTFMLGLLKINDHFQSPQTAGTRIVIAAILHAEVQLQPHFKWNIYPLSFPLCPEGPLEPVPVHRIHHGQVPSPLKDTHTERASPSCGEALHRMERPSRFVPQPQTAQQGFSPTDAVPSLVLGLCLLKNHSLCIHH